DLWATWCGPCRREIPHLIALAKEFKGRGVEVIGLTREDPAKDAEKVRQFVGEFNINYPIGWANGEFASGLMKGRNSIPQTYVIGRDGHVRKYFVGFNAETSPPQLRAAVEEAVTADEVLTSAISSGERDAQGVDDLPAVKPPVLDENLPSLLARGHDSGQINPSHVRFHRLVIERRLHRFEINFNAHRA